MEVVVQSPSRSHGTVDNFDLSSVMISPYLSAPSSPKRFGEYYSEFYQEYDFISSSSSNIPFEAPKKKVDGDEDDDGFAFYVNVNDESNTWSRSAEELFVGGKIKPFKPKGNEIITSHKTTGKKNESRSGDVFSSGTEQRGRGRDKTPTSVLSTSNSGRRVTRSHSPYRISQYTCDEQPQQQQLPQQPENNIEEATLKSTSSFMDSRASSSCSSSKGSKRWRLRDFILFRSASEGRGSIKESFKKESVGYKKGEVGTTSMRRKGPVSAHEMHYAMKKAESEDLKKRTFLPYKQGILGRLAGFRL